MLIGEKRRGRKIRKQRKENEDKKVVGKQNLL